MPDDDVPILARVPRRLACPNCDHEELATLGMDEQRFHTCSGLQGLTAPLVDAGTDAKVEAVERGDYVGRENVQTDGNGRPVMAVITTRDEGQDCTVFAPCATAELEY